MRICLISLPLPGEEAQPIVAGKSLARRQLLFAQEAGCSNVIAFGGGASPDAIDLRHAAERSGMKFQVITSAHALPGIVGDDDSLLVFQPDLLPESRTALDLLRADGDRILVVSAGPGVAAGLERIDLDRAWAGALTIPGHLLNKLSSLPEDVAPHGALLRIALQHRLPEARLADDTLDDGRWAVVVNAESAMIRTRQWQQTHLPEVQLSAPSRWLGRTLVAGWGHGLLGKRYAAPVMLGAVLALLTGGLIAGYYERPALGFALVAASVPALEAFLALKRLGAAPFGKLARWPAIRRIVDLAILALGIMAIDSLPHRAIFPPAVLAAGLILLDRKKLRNWLEPVRDRMTISAVIALIASVAMPELAVMLAGVLVILANITPDRG